MISMSTKIVTHNMKPLTAHAHCMSSFQRLGVFEHRVFDQQCVTASLSQAVQVLFVYCTKEFVKLKNVLV